MGNHPCPSLISILAPTLAPAPALPALPLNLVVVVSLVENWDCVAGLLGDDIVELLLLVELRLLVELLSEALVVLLT